MPCKSYNNYVKALTREEMNGKRYVMDLIHQIYRIVIGTKNKYCQKNIKIHEYIDVSKLHKQGINKIDDIIQFEAKILHIIAVCVLIEQAVDENIYLIPVVDGKAPLFKKKVLKERKKIRERATQKKLNIDDKYSKEYIKQDKKCVFLTNSHYEDIHELLDASGLPYIKSPGEADPQCAAIARGIDNIAGVITSDYDVIIYGASSIIKEFSKRNKTYYKLNRHDIIKNILDEANQVLLKNNKKSISSLNENILIDLAFISQNKYFASKTFDFAFKNYILCDMDMKLTINKLFDSIDSKDIIDEWNRTVHYYTSAIIYNPSSLNLNINTPDINKLTSIMNRCCFSKIIIKKIINGLKKQYLIANGYE